MKELPFLKEKLNTPVIFLTLKRIREVLEYKVWICMHVESLNKK
jgi:hypothetical protein